MFVDPESQSQSNMARASLWIAAALLCVALPASALTEKCGIYPDIKFWIKTFNIVQFNGTQFAPW